MIELDPGVRDHFLVLEPHERFEDYARTYGDAIAEHYEDRGVVVVPMPVRLDLDYFQRVVFPPQWKKIGTHQGIDRPVDASHPFAAHFGDLQVARRLQSEIASLNGQLRAALRALFPRYRSLKEANITWRLLETRDEGMHLDIFNKGAPLDPRAKAWLRLKFFLNIDSEPRRWRTSFDLPELLQRSRHVLPEALPDDLNVVNDLLDKLGVLERLPAHRVAYPTLSAVFVNAEVVAHEVVYGRRLVAGEFFCEAADMLDPGKLPHARLASWLANAGYGIAPDAAAVAARHAHLKGGYQRQQELLAKPG